MSASSASWGSGYVTDLAYVPGYYPHQSPLHLHLACLLGGVAGLPRDLGALSYLELGCGHGFGATALAACNPGWRITAVDFNPAHVAAAREFAADCGVANVRFVEADLTVLADSALAAEIPPADVVSLHGLWSWVGDTVQAGIVRLLDARLKPGGIAHLSYNALPAWQGALGMQRLMLEAGRRAAGRSDRQAVAGLALVQELAEAGARHLADDNFVRPMLERISHSHGPYLAHEFLNESWRPCFHADVVRALAAAKLDWVGSAHLVEHFSPLVFGEGLRAIAARFDDPLMRELIKDLCLPRGLRDDVFVRGARRLGDARRDELLGEVMLALVCPQGDFAWEIDLPSGRATFERGFFGPIVAALEQGPARVRDLLALPDLPRRDNPAELVGMLVGTAQAMPILGRPTDPEPAVRRLNRLAAQRFVRPDNLSGAMALACSGTGAPLTCQMLDLLIAERLRSSPSPDPSAWAGELAVDVPESERQRLVEHIGRRIAERAPIWRRFGALDPDAVGTAADGAAPADA